MSKAQELHAKADLFAARAAGAKGRTARNTYLSLEQTVRSLAIREQRGEDARHGAAGAEDMAGA